MADFEGLIRQALARQNSADPAVRERIYRSSRNALGKMLEKSGNEPGSVSPSHLQQLEDAIGRIEAEYAPASPNLEPQVQIPAGPSPSAQPIPQPAVPEPQPAAADKADLPPIVQPETDYPTAEGAGVSPETGQPGVMAKGTHLPDVGKIEEEYVPTYKRKSWLLRIAPTLLVLTIFLVAAWVLYALFVNMPARQGNNAPSESSAPVGEAREAADGSIYVTLLQPTDLSALVTAGRGAAELVTEQNSQVLRLQSLRSDSARSQSAEPILLELQKGVLQQLQGKSATVELSVKSGGGGPGQFAVECNIGGESVCGRKRFRVGLQPEKIVFALNTPERINAEGEAHLAISTDVTSTANTTGAGDPIDILFVRLRVSDD